MAEVGIDQACLIVPRQGGCEIDCDGGLALSWKWRRNQDSPYGVLFGNRRKANRRFELANRFCLRKGGIPGRGGKPMPTVTQLWTSARIQVQKPCIAAEESTLRDQGKCGQI